MTRPAPFSLRCERQECGSPRRLAVVSTRFTTGYGWLWSGYERLRGGHRAATARQYRQVMSVLRDSRVIAEKICAVYSQQQRH